MSRICSYLTESAAGIACRMACGSGASAPCCCEQPARATPANTIDAKRTCRVITSLNSPRDRWNIVLARPHQRNDPSNHAPAEKEIQQEDRERIALAARQRNDRRQEVQK